MLQTPCWKLALVGAVLLVASCATLEPDKPWPQGAAPQENFVRHYQADKANQKVQTPEQYMYWVRRFYRGYSLIPGWLSITEQVMKSLDGDDHAWAGKDLKDLGERIGSEWAKDNGVRRINTRMTAIWGQAAIEAVERGDLENFVRHLRDDVEALLEGHAGAGEITLEHYYNIEVAPF